ncbi:Coiled-coil domain-containing protein 97 [Melipona quadrifasciata]|uniref:Coiled-coil domain-containing protein 97 n=1 Tax=Melipona quadrifasciata TaxID=166423 RepID=A0A0N1ITG9_9HYME|nr:Coiled-coil domain-containing protein 97 [Melipona quadrifasciata]
MNKEEDKQNNVPKVIIDDKNDNNNSQQISLNEVDKNSEEKLLHHVAKSKAIFKSQQKDDPDLTFEEKLIIARNILQKSYCLFLSKFGHYMKKEHLTFFAKNKNEDYEIAYYFNKLQRYFNSSTRQTDVKNRRYQALKTLIKEGEYFSESEMMKRNPLLYKHLIGQYMTEEQKRLRDNIDTKNITLVNLLIENIERDNLKMKQKLQEEEEQSVLEENDTDEEQEIVYTSKNYGEKATYWAIIPTVENKVQCKNEIIKNPYCISKSQKQVLKQEFITTMYQNFLDGKDVDFDYSTVDENEAYDNIDLRTQDEEDKYFDSESPETIGSIEDTNEIETEDELDIYMKSLKVN